jgi:hypothetical protein
MHRLRKLILVDRRTIVIVLATIWVHQRIAETAQAQVLPPSDQHLQTALTLSGTAGGPGGLAGHAGIASLISVGDRHRECPGICA